MSWSGATAGAITGAQIGSAILPGWGTAIGAGLGGLGGWFTTRRTGAEKSLEDFYAQLGQGMSPEQAAQEKSIAASKAEAAEAENRAKLIKRGGASTSGIASANALQAAQLARLAKTEGEGKLAKEQAERSLQMKIAGMQGTASIEQQKRLDKEKAANLLLTSDIGTDTLSTLGENLSQIG